MISRSCRILVIDKSSSFYCIERWDGSGSVHVDLQPGPTYHVFFVLRDRAYSGPLKYQSGAVFLAQATTSCSNTQSRDG